MQKVRNPDIDDYKKLTRVMQYTTDMTKLSLTIKPSDSPKWLVDILYAIHPYMMKSHRGIFKEQCTQHPEIIIEHKELSERF